LHGDEELYASGYTDAALKDWARKIKTWSTGGIPFRSKLNASRAESCTYGRDVYVYFDNDVKVHAPFDAISLARRLHVSPPYAGEKR
jgi:uncharacterized protein YecE (DUF72 family)